MMLISCYGAEHAHIIYSELVFKFGTVRFQDIDIFLAGLHIPLIYWKYAEKASYPPIISWSSSQRISISSIWSFILPYSSERSIIF